MIIETKNATVESNIPEGVGKRRQMKVSEAGMVHIVGMLTNAYKDPETAVIRENFTNGVDAHARAGVKDRPVKVTLPTWDKPNYVVTDEGCGMSEDDLLDVYSQYGESSKLETNEEAGGFGIGAKSGLAIASQFTVVSVKDGRKSVGLITKSSGLPDINVLSNEPTDEPNGTTVTIPVKDTYEFNNKARAFFSYVDPSSVLVDGKTPKYALDAATEVTDPKNPDFKAYVQMHGRNWGTGPSYLIMGNVPYSISEEDLSNAMGKAFNNDVNRHILAMTKYFMVPIGSVDLTLNREGLMYTDKTKDLIKDNMSKLTAAIKTSAQAEADAAEDFYNYFKIKRKWKNNCGWDLTYKGKEWADNVSLSKATRKVKRSLNGSSSHENISRFHYDAFDTYFFVTGLKGDEYTKINNSLTPFLRGRDEEEGIFIITESTEHLTDERTKNNKMIEIISYEKIIEEAKAQRKIDRANAVKSNKTEPEKLKYPVLVVAENKVEWMPYNEIPGGSPYAAQEDSTEYLSHLITSAYEKYGSYNAAVYAKRVGESLRNLSDYSHVVLVGGARTPDAFLKRVPGSPNLNKFLNEKILPKYTDLLTDEVKQYAAYTNSNWSRLFKSLGTDLTDKIKDDRLKSIASPASHVKESIKKLTQMRSHMTNVKYFYRNDIPDVNVIDDNELIDELNNKYPLIRALSYSIKEVPSDHIVAYINAVESIDA